MINTFIAALVALFFWGKSSKDLDEKTQLASWVRTCVYGVLTFLILVFYIKTYQVATVHHTIQVHGLKQTVNADGKVADSIPTIDFHNSFSSHITENYHATKIEDPEEVKFKEVSKEGGLFMVLQLHSGPAYTFEKNPKITQQDNDFGVINGNLNKKRYEDYIVDACSHAYVMSYITSSIPSLIPFFPTFNSSKEIGFDNSETYQWVKVGDVDSFGDEFSSSVKFKDVESNSYEIKNSDIFREMYAGCTVYCDTITNLDSFYYKYKFTNNFSQRMGFFTAADVSQYTCDIDLESDCYINRVRFIYDLPIETTQQDSNMIMTAYSFIIKGDFLNKEIANQGHYRFHVKFPTLANLQLIRSLILTTLLTALVSLFLSNLFYLFRKYVIRFKDKHLSEISVERARTFRKQMFFLAFAFMAFIIYIAWRIFKERPYHIDIEIYDWLCNYWVLLFFIVLVIICVLLYFMFRKAYTIKKKDKS